jgi:hypothetical protein
MKKLLLLILLIVTPALAQQHPGDPSNPLGGNLILVDAGTCSTPSSFLQQKLPINASTTTVNLAGTFSATVTIRESNNGGSSWVTAGTQNAVGTATYSTNGFTDFCVDVTTYTSGSVAVTISTGIQAQGGGGSGSSFPVTTPVAVNSGGSITVNTGGSIGTSGTGTITATNGVGGSTNSAAPTMGYYFTNQCLVANTGQCYYTTADVQQVKGCSWATSGPTITCTNSVFAPTDCVGGSGCTGTGTSKTLMGWQSCDADGASTVLGQGAITTTTNVTIATYISGTQVTISSNPANAATIQTGPPAGGCIIWGHLDDTNASTLDTAVQASTVCPKIFMAATGYFFNTPHFYTQPASCLGISPGLQPGGGFGNTTLPAGYEIEGRGVGNTAWYLTTGFPGSDTCQHTPTANGTLTPAHVGACFVVPVMGKWQDFRIDGGGNVTPSAFNGKTLIYLAVATLQNFTCVNYGAYEGGNSVGIETSFQGFLTQVNNSGCGATAFWQDSGSGLSHFLRVVAENSGFAALQIAGPNNLNAYFSALPSITCHFCDFSLAANQPFGASAAILNAGGNLVMFGGWASPGNIIGTVNNGNWDYQATVSGSKLRAEGVSFPAFGGSTNTNGAISCTAACTNWLLNDTIQGQSSSFVIQDVTGSKEYSLGGNTFTGAFSINAGSGLFLAPTDTLSSTTGTVPTCASTGLTQSACAVTGTNEKGTIRVTAGGVGGAFTETLTFLGTFSGPSGAAPECTFQYANTSTAWTTPTLLTTSSKSTTSYVIAGTATTISADNYDMDYACTAR